MERVDESENVHIPDLIINGMKAHFERTTEKIDEHVSAISLRESETGYILFSKQLREGETIESVTKPVMAPRGPTAPSMALKMDVDTLMSDLDMSNERPSVFANLTPESIKRIVDGEPLDEGVRQSIEAMISMVNHSGELIDEISMKVGDQDGEVADRLKGSMQLIQSITGSQEDFERLEESVLRGKPGIVEVAHRTKGVNALSLKDNVCDMSKWYDNIIRLLGTRASNTVRFTAKVFKHIKQGVL